METERIDSVDSLSGCLMRVPRLRTLPNMVSLEYRLRRATTHMSSKDRSEIVGERGEYNGTPWTLLGPAEIDLSMPST